MTTVLTAERDGWPAVVSDVLRRDGACIFADQATLPFGLRGRVGWTGHACRGRYGEPIDWARWSVVDLHRRGHVELDHVKEEPMIGAKAPDDSAHLVVACHAAHHGGLATSHDGREFERAWLAKHYPDVWTTFIERRTP